MGIQLCVIPNANSSITILPIHPLLFSSIDLGKRRLRRFSVECSTEKEKGNLRTCKNCKAQFDPLLNHPRETRRKFESVYSGGTMDTPDGGKVFQYWHCCGSEDPFDRGCTAAPHASYDD
ncbi:unnamed protein product [Withania somnifera]